jgi:hypothetical protein
MAFETRYLARFELALLAGIKIALDNRHRILVRECLLNLAAKPDDVIGGPAIGVRDGFADFKPPPDIPAVE